MAAVSHATLLNALDAAVIDSETTGLDPRTARIVELAAVRMTCGRVEPEASLAQRIDPGEPIPASATAIHGIDADALKDAPDFAHAWPRFADVLGARVVIGHTLGFDMAILARECERAGIAWRAPVTLDTRLLAQVAEPSLAGYSLESLAAWLGLEVSGRHSARGDALAAGRIFEALVPRLRERNIRTLAEALRACRALTAALDAQHQAGWSEPPPASAALDDAAGRRIDGFAYRTRVSAVMSAPPRVIEAGTSLGAALDIVSRERISSLFVVPNAEIENASASSAGIVTERDLLRAIAKDGAAALAQPAGGLASRPLVTVPADALAYLAIGRMNRLGIRHLGVTDGEGRLAGALSARDLLRLRGEDAIELGDELSEARDAAELARSWARLPHTAAGLIRDGMPAREIAAAISQRLGEMTHRAATLAEAELQAAGRGGPPCDYSVMVLGSAGRGESLLAMDQDNALVFADEAPPEADAWFAALGARMADILHEAGVPYCKGGVMAKNAAWRGSLADWRRRMASWFARSDPQDLLAVDIFFDLRGVHGASALSETLRREAFDMAKGRADFAKLLVEAAGPVESGLTWLGGIRTEDGRIDLKRTGLFGVVSAARALAIRHHVVERSTPARLEGVKAKGLGSESDLDALVAAQGTFLDLILAQQIEDIEKGRPPGNAVEVSRLSRRDRARLGEALAAVRSLDEVVRSLLFAG